MNESPKRPVFLRVLFGALLVVELFRAFQYARAESYGSAARALAFAVVFAIFTRERYPRKGSPLFYFTFAVLAVLVVLVAAEFLT